MERVGRPSPNFGPRRGEARPTLVVLHYTAMPSCAEARGRLCDPAAEVSAHYLISELGQGHALVAEDQRAWHAGAGAWGAITDVNSHSIGIELANPGDAPFPEPQMAALERLLAGIMARWDAGDGHPAGRGWRRKRCWRIPIWRPSASAIRGQGSIGSVWRGWGCRSGLMRRAVT